MGRLRTAQLGMFGLLLAVLLGPPAARAAPGATGTEKRRVIGLPEAGSRVSLAQDELLAVELRARPSTGYSWHVEAVDGAVLALAGREHESAPGLGGADVERLLFTGAGSGTTTLKLGYRRSWEPLKAGDDTYQVEVIAAGPYSGTYTPPPPPAPLEYRPSGMAVARLNVCDPGDGSFSKCTPARNQGSNNACWAFATTGVFENVLQLANPSGNYDLSEQYVISCNPDGYTAANGGYDSFGLWIDKYVSPENAAGAVYESDFPYQGTDLPCGWQPHPHHEKLTSFTSAGRQGVASVDAIKQAITAHGPVYAAVCADNAMTSYTGGVFKGGCTQVNHAIILVGWDDNGGNGYWFLRNSWGSNFGDQGYMKIAYGAAQVGTDLIHVDYAGSTPPPTSNTPPVADAGTNQTVQANATVTLDGSRSSDPDGTIARYAWAQASGSPTVTLSGASAARASFAAPSSAATLGFTLTVTDDKGATHSATVTVTVGSSPPPATNTPPVADAGTNQTVQPNASVTLDGSRSSDADGTIARYAWAQTSGSPTVTLSGASAARASFAAPATAATLGFTLTVTDDKGAASTATVTVTVGSSPPPSSNAPPIAYAGAAQEVKGGDIVTLDGTGSWDRDGSIASYAWAQTAGPRVELSGATGPTATFTAPAGPVSLAFELVVTDDAGASGRASVPVKVDGAAAAGCSSAGGSGLGVGSLACLLGLLGWRRRPLPGGRNSMKRWMAERALGTIMLLALLTSCADPAGGGAPGTTQVNPQAAEAPTLESLSGPEAQEAVAAARAGLQRFLAAIPAGKAESFGFADRAERDRATLGVPYRVWTSDAQANGIAATDEWRFPVTVDGSHRALLTVAQLQGAYRAVDLGAAVLSRELGALESARGVAAGSRRVLLRLHPVQADLAAFPGAGARVEESSFEPLASARAASGGPRSAVEPMNLMPWVRERQAKPSTR